MVLLHILARLKSLFLTFISLVRRALCCFSRRRKPSYSDCEVLTSVNVVQNNNNRDRDWNSWDETPRTVEEHIEQYRQKLTQSKVDENNEPAVDFFQDMTPKVLKQKNYFIDKNKAETENFSRLQASSAANIPRLQTAELEDWSDEDNDDKNQTGWDEINDEMTKEMIREKRRELRAQRHKRLEEKKHQQNQMHNGLFAKQ